MRTDRSPHHSPAIQSWSRPSSAVGVISVALCITSASSGLVRAEMGAADLWIREPAGRSTVTAAYGSLPAKRALTLGSVTSPVADSVELHEMKMDGDVMRMKPLHQVNIGAGQSLTLKPGGLHLMFIGIKEPLKSGDKVPVTLHWVDEKGQASQTRLNVPVRPLADQKQNTKGHSHP